MIDYTIAESGINIASTSYAKSFSFRKEEGRWIMESQNQIGASSLSNEMLVGKDDLLDMLAKRKNKIRLSLDTVPFDHARALDLVEICNTPGGGGIYTMRKLKEIQVNKRLWLCDFLLLVLGDIPETIYIRKETF